MRLLIDSEPVWALTVWLGFCGLGRRPKRTEVVVFDENRAYPEFIVTYSWPAPPNANPGHRLRDLMTIDQAPAQEPWLTLG
eukprot:3295343-Rhodomonas_salina.2